MIDLKVYSNSKLTRELPKVNNIYTNTIDVVTRIDYLRQSTLYVKNIGDRTAYNVAVSINDNLNGDLSITIDKTQIKANETAVIIFTLPVTTAVLDENHPVTLTINYDYLP